MVLALTAGLGVGLSHALNLGTVLSASTLGVVAYAALFGQLNAWAAASLHPYAVFGSVLVFLLAAWLVGRAVHRTR